MSAIPELERVSSSRLAQAMWASRDENQEGGIEAGREEAGRERRGERERGRERRRKGEGEVMPIVDEICRLCCWLSGSTHFLSKHLFKHLLCDSVPHQ